VGPTGPAGSGATGATGPTGAAGAAGATGATGAAGVVPVYSNTSVLQTSQHIVTGSVSFGNSTASINVTLSGPSSPYTSATTYSCALTGSATNALSATNGSGTQFTIARSGNGSETVTYICIGS
jgi:hypothetical protein